MNHPQNRIATLVAICLPALVVLITVVRAAEGQNPADLMLAKEGQARLPILAGSVRAPVSELQQYLETMTGVKFAIEAVRTEQAGILVGLPSDFPWLRVDGLDTLGKEGFIVKSDGKNLLLIARSPEGVRHAVSTFLHSLGCRWYFPGKTWEVIPRRPELVGSWDLRQRPSFALQRKLWYGFGAPPVCARDLADWERHNRMGGPIPITIGHSWHGLDLKTDFENHPEWFALVSGQRQPSHPCYSHPEVAKRAIEHALAQAAKGVPMISMTPVDGLGYCECERCLAVCQGGKPYKDFGATFAKRPDGVLVNVTSETLFAFINEVAAAVAAKHPQTLIGCYAYSAYSHPPSFKLHPNVFLQTTTAFRRTPLSLTEQLQAFHKRGIQSGIRGYFSVYQWDWDDPAIAKGDLALPQLVEDLRFYQKHNVQSINAEAGCNWGPRGLGYYLAGRLLWDVHEDPKAIIADFYDKAFGPAALPMERYYVRWLGAYAAVRTKPPAGNSPPKGADKALDELGYAAPEAFGVETLKAAYRDLDEAARLVQNQPECRARVDHLRLYAHYLFLRTRVEAAANAKDKARVPEAIAGEMTFGARLMNTGMIHSRPLVGKEFYRRFLRYKDYLEGTPEWPESQRDAVAKAAGQGYRQLRDDVPEREELERLWREDQRVLGIR